MKLAVRKLTMYSVSVLLGAVPKPSIPSGKRRGLAGAQHNKSCCSCVIFTKRKLEMLKLYTICRHYLQVTDFGFHLNLQNPIITILKCKLSKLKI